MRSVAGNGFPSCILSCQPFIIGPHNCVSGSHSQCSKIGLNYFRGQIAPEHHNQAFPSENAGQTPSPPHGIYNHVGQTAPESLNQTLLYGNRSQIRSPQVTYLCQMVNLQHGTDVFYIAVREPLVPLQHFTASLIPRHNYGVIFKISEQS